MHAFKPIIHFGVYLLAARIFFDIELERDITKQKKLATRYSWLNVQTVTAEKLIRTTRK
jgi:hypothetical protein